MTRNLIRINLSIILIICSLLLLLLSSINYAQDLSLVSEWKIDQIQQIESDELGNIYVIHNKNHLIRINNQNEVDSFNDFGKYGKITNIDVSNPLSIILTFSRQNSIMILDRMLTPKMSYNLAAVNMTSVKSVASSRDGNLWIYDPINYKIIKLNNQLNRILESNDLNIAYNLQMSTPVIQERNERLTLVDERDGICIFDRYGNLVQQLDIPGIKTYQLTDEFIFYLLDNKIKFYDLKAKKENNLVTNFPSTIIDFFVRNNSIIIADNNSLKLFSFK